MLSTTTLSIWLLPSKEDFNYLDKIAINSPAGDPEKIKEWKLVFEKGFL